MTVVTTYSFLSMYVYTCVYVFYAVSFSSPWKLWVVLGATPQPYLQPATYLTGLGPSLPSPSQHPHILFERPCPLASQPLVKDLPWC